jgi:hypothetical protein
MDNTFSTGLFTSVRSPSAHENVAHPTAVRSKTHRSANNKRSYRSTTAVVTDLFTLGQQKKADHLHVRVGPRFFFFHRAFSDDREESSRGGGVPGNRNQLNGKVFFVLLGCFLIVIYFFNY